MMRVGGLYAMVLDVPNAAIALLRQKSHVRVKNQEKKYDLVSLLCDDYPACNHAMQLHA